MNRGGWGVGVIGEASDSRLGCKWIATAKDVLQVLAALPSDDQKQVSVAAVNGPKMTVVSGRAFEILIRLPPASFSTLTRCRPKGLGEAGGAEHRRREQGAVRPAPGMDTSNYFSACGSGSGCELQST